MFSRNLSVSKQVALRIVLLGLVIATFVFSFLIPIQIRLDRKHAIEHADLVADAITSAYNVLDRPEELDSISQLLIDAAGSSDVAWVRIVGHDNEILYSTDPEQMKRDESYLQGEKQIGTMLYVTRKIAVSHSPVQAIEVAMDLSIIQAESKLLFAKLIFAVLALLALLALFIGRMTHKLVGERLQKLATAMGNAEKGSFLVRAQVDRIDEVGLLAIAFNKLLAALTRMQVKEIEWEHDLQEAHEQLSIKDQLERANKSLKRRIKAQELLTEASHHLGGVLNKNTLVQRLVDLLKNKLGWSDFGIFLLTPESTLRMQIASGFLDTPFFEHLEFQFGEGITGIAAESKKPLFIPDIEKDTRVLFKDRPELPRGSTLAVPMLYQERVIGVMTFFRQEPSAFDEQDINMLDTLGAFISIALKNAELYEETLELATTDSLTGLLNRRAMQRMLERELRRAERFSKPLSIMLVDVDHFKPYNDRMGHLMGDEALKQIAKCLQTSVRKIDGVSRFGGEEFCLVLPETSPEAAKEVAKKLNEAIKKLDIKGAKEQPLGYLSVSIGISWFPKTKSKDLFDQADRALYAAKNQGRDRTVLYGE